MSHSRTTSVASRGGGGSAAVLDGGGPDLDIPAQLQGDGGQVPRRRRHDLAAHPGAPVEEDVVEGQLQQRLGTEAAGYARDGWELWQFNTLNDHGGNNGLILVYRRPATGG